MFIVCILYQYNRGVELVILVHLSVCYSVRLSVRLSVCCKANKALCSRAILMNRSTHASYGCTPKISWNQPDMTDVSYSCHINYRPNLIIHQDISSKLATLIFFYVYKLQIKFKQYWTNISFSYHKNYRQNFVVYQDNVTKLTTSVFLYVYKMPIKFHQY